MSSTNICNPCIDCPPPNKMDAADCNPIPQCNEIINTSCIEYTGVDLTCLTGVKNQDRLNAILIALDAQICTLINRFPVKPPCPNISGSITAVLTVDTPTPPPVPLKACFYNMQDNTYWMLEYLYCGSETITFTIPSVVINGVELIPYGKPAFTTTLTKSNLKLVTANNSYDVIGCSSGQVLRKGVIYTNFVDLFNTMFVSLGLNNYKAQIAYNQYSNLPADPDGFYIIYPESDTFYIKTTSDKKDSPDVLNLKYTENSLVYWDNSSASAYKGMSCLGINLVGNKVVETDITGCGESIKTGI